MCPTNSSVKWSIQTQNQEDTNVGSTPVRKFHWHPLKISFFLLLHSFVKCSITAFALFNSVDLIFSHSTPYGFTWFMFKWISNLKLSHDLNCHVWNTTRNDITTASWGVQTLQSKKRTTGQWKVKIKKQVLFIINFGFWRGIMDAHP